MKKIFARELQNFGEPTKSNFGRKGAAIRAANCKIKQISIENLTFKIKFYLKSSAAALEI